MRLISIGYGNMVAAERIVAVLGSVSSPTRRLLSEARERGMLIDATCGRKTKSVILTDSDHCILAAVTPELLLGRMNEEDESEVE